MGHPFYIVVAGTIALSTHWSINHDINVTIYNGPRTKTTTLMSRLYSAELPPISEASEFARVMSSFLFSWAFEIFRVMSSFLKGPDSVGAQTQNSLASITLGHSVRSKEVTIFSLY